MAIGEGTNKQSKVSLKITDIERRQIERVAKHYNMSMTRMILSLIKREDLRINTKNT